MPQSNQTFNTYLEHHDNSANKHKWYRVTIESTITQSNEVHEVFYAHGRISANCVPKLKETFNSISQANALADKLVRAKVNGRDRYNIVNELNQVDGLRKFEGLLKDKKEQEARVKSDAKAKKMMKNASKEEQRAIVLSTRLNVISIGYLKMGSLMPYSDKVLNPLDVEVDTFDAVTIVKNTDGKVMIKNVLGHFGDISEPINKPVFAISN